MPTSKPYDYINTATGALTTPPGGPRILIHTRQGNCVGIYCDQPAKILQAYELSSQPLSRGRSARPWSRPCRRIDQNSPCQAADVYVDGHSAGTWYHPDQNPFIRWFDSEFDLLADLTRCKSALRIRLPMKKDGSYSDFTDSCYDVFVFENHSRRQLCCLGLRERTP